MQYCNEHMFHLLKDLLVQSGSVTAEKAHKNEKLNATL